jgi:hypothetical protein
VEKQPKKKRSKQDQEAEQAADAQALELLREEREEKQQEDPMLLPQVPLPENLASFSSSPAAFCSPQGVWNNGINLMPITGDQASLAALQMQKQIMELQLQLTQMKQPPVQQSLGEAVHDKVKGDRSKIDVKNSKMLEGLLQPFDYTKPAKPQLKQFNDVAKQALLSLYVKHCGGEESEMDEINVKCTQVFNEMPDECVLSNSELPDFIKWLKGCVQEWWRQVRKRRPSRRSHIKHMRV